MNIGLIYTGGTIGCAGTPLTPLTTMEFSTAFASCVTPIINSQYSDCTITFLPIAFSTVSGYETLDSTNLQPSNWTAIAGKILENYTSCDGFIILHGTDSMAWTASALSFLLTGYDSHGNINAILDKPVIITGSQLPLFYQETATSPITKTLYSTDALENICGSIASIYAGITEVGLYFDAHLYRGNRTVKTNASEFDAFSTPNYPPMGEYGVEFTLYNEHIFPQPASSAVALSNSNGTALAALKAQVVAIDTQFSSDTAPTKVLPFLAYPGHYTYPGMTSSTTTVATSVIADQINALVALDLDGLILESYGEGNFPSGNPSDAKQGAIYTALENAKTKSVVIMNCTQVIHGKVNSNAYLSGAWLADPAIDARGSYDMTPVATLAKLYVLTAVNTGLNYSWTADDIGNFMQKNYNGEISDLNVLDSRGQSFLLPGQSISALDGPFTLRNDFDKGPVLTNNITTSIVWQPLSTVSDPIMPGRLIMQTDGNLVFYDRTNTPVYASNLVSSNVTCKLVLEAGADDDAYLYVYDYRNNVTVTVVYGEPSV